MYTYNYSQASYEFANYFNDNKNFDDFIRNLTLGNSISLGNTVQKYYILAYDIFPVARLTFQGENLLNIGSEGTITSFSIYASSMGTISASNLRLGTSTYINDFLNLRSSNEKIIGSSFSDIYYGYGGNDLLLGGNGSDTLYGGNGKDRLVGGNGSDTLYGGNGKDTLNGGSGNDHLIGGAGNDTANFSSKNNRINLASTRRQNTGDGRDILTGIENVDGGSGNDIIIGNNSANTLYGGNGKDRLVGGNGSDTLYGGNGFDTITGGAGNDIFQINNGAGRDVITDYGTGNDRIELLSGLTGNDLSFSYAGGHTKIWNDNDLLAIVQNTVAADIGFIW